MIAIEQLASDFKSLLEYFCGYWEIRKIFFLNIFNNKMIKTKFSRVQYLYMLLLYVYVHKLPVMYVNITPIYIG